VTSINVIGLSAKAPHPNGAKLLINYILFEEGQTVIRGASRVPIRPGVKPTAAKLDQSTLKIHYVPSDMHKNIAQYEKEFRDIFWKK
jgi:ABC-type Fe3+ transport system substrate-binding protein